MAGGWSGLAAHGWVEPVLLWLVFMIVALTTLALLAPSEAEHIARKRLRDLRLRGVPPDQAEQEELARPFSQRVLRPAWERMVEAAERWTPQGVAARWERLLAAAGRPLGLGTLACLKAAGAAAGLVPGWVAGGWLAAGTSGAGAAGAAFQPVVAVLGAATGWILPDAALKARANRRKRQLARALPDVMDLLSVAVEAGLGLDGAVQKVTEKFPAPVSTEFRQYLKELRLGVSREEALRSLADRAELPELRSFAAAVIQADRLGVSLARVLRVQAEQLRFQRKQRAEEQAMKTPIKMLLPLVLFIFPTLFIVLLGPALIQILSAFAR
ncbi:type II secretion system F family protein [Thermaerobacter sp. PB12/4term]|uniref:type II secretion system F family protein n=1 Tax=Thermaerobacter sp. PB12/4term TaxID=2293838 RepID=UPI000E32841E|nr:type II secretion system F family protein [Thermaerobacter sp. PB12/4term]QIA27131.1 type II secretion system F family protein [Thermaerobacter sp. PB12/4term]